MRKDWIEVEFSDLLDYLQPTNYIVKNTNYDDTYKTPVLTPGKSFIKGYTNETDGIFNALPVIIFDDFTTASKYVNFPFKVKSSAMKILVPTSSFVDLKFAFYGMQVNRVRNDTHKRYWISVYSKKNFSIPPLPEQRAIVAKIEQLFSELDNGIANLKAAKAKLEIYRQAVLKKAFEGALTKEWREQQTNLPTADALLEQIKVERKAHYQHQLKAWQQSAIEWDAQGRKGKKPGKPKLKKQEESKFNSNLPLLPKTWRWVNFSNLGFWTGGGTPSKAVKDYWHEGKILWISPKDMKSKVVSETIDRITLLAVDNSSAKLISEGSILFVVRSGILRRILPIAITAYRSTINQDLQALTPFLVNSEYIYWYSFSDEYNIRQKCAKDGTTVESVETLLLKQYQFPLCSLKEQHQIVQKIESRLSVCDKLTATIDESLQKAEALRQSILKKAFEGKLLSEAELEACRKEPDWEPAEELLKRIRKKEQPATGNLFEI